MVLNFGQILFATFLLSVSSTSIAIHCCLIPSASPSCKMYPSHLKKPILITKSSISINCQWPQKANTIWSQFYLSQTVKQTQNNYALPQPDTLTVIRPLIHLPIVHTVIKSGRDGHSSLSLHLYTARKTAIKSERKSAEYRKN